MDLCYDHVTLFHVYVYFAKTLRYTWIPFESFAFHAKSIYIDSIVVKEYVCILIALTKHTYAMKYNFVDFHVLKICDGCHDFKIYDLKEY